MPLVVEHTQIVEGFPAVDLAIANNIGDWCCINDFRHLAVILHAAPGTAGENPVLKLEQAKDVSGTDVKAFDFTEIWKKQAVTDLSSVLNFIRITQSLADTYTNATAGEDDLIWMIEINDDDLDKVNGFDCIRASIVKTGVVAQIGWLVYVATEPIYSENLPTDAITD